MANGDLEAARERLLAEAPCSFSDDHCANCFAPLGLASQSLYCDEWCREVAVLVRYARGVWRDPLRSDDVDVQEAIGIRVALALRGGYAALDRKLSAAVREEVIRRDGGRCQACGEPGAEIDHIDGSSSALRNLQLLCHACHPHGEDARFNGAGWAGGGGTRHGIHSCASDAR